MKKSRKKKALVTGGAGFIGSHLCEELLQRGWQVSAIDNLSTGYKSNIAPLLKDTKNFKFYKDSIMNEALMRRLIKGSDVVYHLAAAVGVQYILKHPIHSILTNIEGTEIVLRCVSKYKKKVIIASSSEVYGKYVFLPFKEDDNMILGPTNISRWSYANAKAADEFLALAYYKERKTPVVILRFFNIVGPRQVQFYGMVLPRFIEQALSGQPMTVYGDGEQVRSFTYVKDAVRAIVDLSLEKKAEGQIFNVGSDEAVTIRHLAHKIKEKTHSASKIYCIPFEKIFDSDFEEPVCRLPDLSKIKRTINYSARYSLESIIDNTLAYIRKKKKSSR